MKTKCNNCGADLEMDLDKLMSYCPYCRSKLLIEVDELAQIIKEKETTKRATVREEQRTKRQQMKYEHEEKKESASFKHTFLPLIIMFVVSIGLLFSSSIPGYLKSKELEKIEISIEEDLKNGNYDDALFKANQLYYDSGDSREEKKAWDQKRESYIQIIKDKKRSVDSSNPNKINIGFSSKDLLGQNYEEVKKHLSTLGFTNVETQKSPKSAGFFDKNNSVEHILIDGVTSFTAEDYFDKDIEIIIYYYVK